MNETGENGSYADGAVVGQWRVLEFLHRDLAGEWYKSEHVRMRRRALLVVLPGDRMDDSDGIHFRRLAGSLPDIRHPHVVRVREMGDADGCCYAALDFVEGPGAGPLSLADELARSGSLPVSRVRQIALQLCSALSYMFSHAGTPTIHGSLDPRNIYLDPDGNAMVAGFGLAECASLPGDNTLAAGEFVSPEQGAGGRPAAAGDIYSLGAILQRCLSGRPASPNGSADMLQGRWASVVDRCMRRNPRDRFSSPAELRRGLTPRRWVPITAAAVAVALLFGVIAFMNVPRNRPAGEISESGTKTAPVADREEPAGPGLGTDDGAQPAAVAVADAVKEGVETDRAEPVGESDTGPELESKTAEAVPVGRGRVGMTSAQVLADLGKPKGSMNLRGKTVWMYDRGRITFEDGVVVDDSVMSDVAWDTKQSERAERQSKRRSSSGTDYARQRQKTASEADAARLAREREAEAEADKRKRKANALSAAQEKYAARVAKARSEYDRRRESDSGVYDSCVDAAERLRESSYDTYSRRSQACRDNYQRLQESTESWYRRELDEAKAEHDREADRIGSQF